MPAIDFTEVQDMDPIPSGRYDAEIVHSEEGVSNSGHPKIDVRWKVLDGEHGNRLVFDTFSFHPNALFRTKDTLKALGWDEEFEGSVEAEDLMGLQAEIAVRVDPGSVNEETGESYDPRNRVSRVRPLGVSSVDVDKLLDK